MDRIEFKKGTMVKVDGIPFELEEDTFFIGVKNNIDLIRNQRSFGVPSVRRDAQPETSETISPSSSSI